MVLGAITYGLLADIADQQSQPDRAAEYHPLAREAKRNFAGTAHEMKGHLPVILGTLQGKAQAAGIAASQTDQEPAASALPLTYFSNGAYPLWPRMTPA